MLRHLFYICSALLIVDAPWARADEPSALSPLAEMRTAAEALADVDPLTRPRPEAALLASAGAAPSTKGNLAAAVHATEALQVVIKEAVQSEVARELSSVVRNRPGQGLLRKVENAREGGRDTAEQLHDAAAQAQQAKQNSAAAKARSQNAMAKGPPLSPPGNGRALGMGGSYRP